ncbi:MAG: hypothetical protein K8I82_01610, partial [Anaerolineae bacterium]|nr:hypothetical protein [Anaerolineae bacterium]
MRNNPMVETWVIEISVQGMSAPMKIQLDKELIIGRSVPGQADVPDIDLAAYGAENMGVSRHHASIYTLE